MRLDIRNMPVVKSQHFNPSFVSECTQALNLCRNLISFKCIVNALPPFLASLHGKERLEDIRVHGNVSTDQAEKLIQVSNLKTLAIDHGSWNLMDVLPRWTVSIKSTLSHLILHARTYLSFNLYTLQFHILDVDRVERDCP